MTLMQNYNPGISSLAKLFDDFFADEVNMLEKVNKY